MRTEQCHTAFFPDFSPATAIRRKAFGPVLKKMTALGLQPFLIYPAVIKLRHKGEQRSFDSPQKAEDFISSMSQQKSMPRSAGDDGGAAAAVSSVRGRGVTAGMDLALAAQKGMIAGCHGCLLNLLFAFSSLILGYCPYLSGTTISLLVRLTLHFSFGGD